MSPNGRYERFPTDCDFSQSAIEEALPKLGPAFVYEVRCHYADVAWMRSALKRLMADLEDNPLSPYMNLVVDDAYARNEWSIHANGNAMGSPGV